MHDVLTPSTGRRFPKPAPIFPSRPCSKAGKPRTIRTESVASHATVSSIAWLGSLRTIMRVIAAIAPFMCQVAGSPVFENRAPAHKLRRILKRSIGSPNSSTEASGRFAVPARWIRAVMQVESGGDEHAIVVSRCHGFDAAHARHLGRTQRSLWSRSRSV